VRRTIRGDHARVLLAPADATVAGAPPSTGRAPSTSRAARAISENALTTAEMNSASLASTATSSAVKGRGRAAVTFSTPIG
jgi:hypothetical protein